MVRIIASIIRKEKIFTHVLYPTNTNISPTLVVKECLFMIYGKLNPSKGLTTNPQRHHAWDIWLSGIPTVIEIQPNSHFHVYDRFISIKTNYRSSNTPTEGGLRYRYSIYLTKSIRKIRPSIVTVALVTLHYKILYPKKTTNNASFSKRIKTADTKLISQDY